VSAVFRFPASAERTLGTLLVAVLPVHDRGPGGRLIPTYQTTQVLYYEVQGNHGATTDNGGATVVALLLPSTTAFVLPIHMATARDPSRVSIRRTDCRSPQHPAG
jgi:hypothetical protein